MLHSIETEKKRFINTSLESNTVYCTDIKGLIDEFKSSLYKPEEWRLFVQAKPKGSSSSQYKQVCFVAFGSFKCT